MASSPENPVIQKPALHVLLCQPRSFCAGVVRAIESVERALTLYGAPVYVRHEIVHNRYVVDALRKKGAIFVEELDEVPDNGAPVILSAHGVPLAVTDEATRRNLFVLVATMADAAAFTPRDPKNLAYVTQTTLSVQDTAEIVDLLKSRFPDISGPHKEDICYATTNRQDAVTRVAPIVDAMIVVGAPNSSNSQRLKEVAERAGCPRAALVQRAADIDWNKFGNIARLGITAGASAPEVLVEEIIDAFAARYEVNVETVTTAEEGVFFPLPRPLRENQAAE